MAIINFRLERLDAAWDDFQDLLASGQYRMDSLYYLARIADYREQYERAVRLYREVRFGSNTVFSQRRAAALLAFELENVDGAFELLDSFAQASPDNAVDVGVEIKIDGQPLLELVQDAESHLGASEPIGSYLPSPLNWLGWSNGRRMIRWSHAAPVGSVTTNAPRCWSHRQSHS